LTGLTLALAHAAPAQIAPADFTNGAWLGDHAGWTSSPPAAAWIDGLPDPAANPGVLSVSPTNPPALVSRAVLPGELGPWAAGTCAVAFADFWVMPVPRRPTRPPRSTSTGPRWDSWPTARRAALLAAATGYEEWSEIGYQSGSDWSEEVEVGYDPEYGYPIYETQYFAQGNWHYLRGIARDRSGNAWLRWEGGDNSYASGPLYNYSFSNSYHNIGRRGGSFVDLGHAFTMGADGSGDIHALAYVDGRARDVRFDGQSGAQEADSRVEGASGTLLGASQSAHSLVVASAGAIAQDSDWSASVSVDGLLSAGSGILLGDGTVVATSDDITALGPVQSGGGGSYFVMGSVGIGTDAPAHGLDVSGDARITGPLSLGQNLAVGGALSAAGGSLSGDMAVGGNLTVASNLTVLGTSDLAGVPARGDIPMGAFTNGPAQ
jgi:hypothetical protein